MFYLLFAFKRAGILPCCGSACAILMVQGSSHINHFKRCSGEQARSKVQKFKVQKFQELSSRFNVQSSKLRISFVTTGCTRHSPSELSSALKKLSQALSKDLASSTKLFGLAKGLLKREVVALFKVPRLFPHPEFQSLHTFDCSTVCGPNVYLVLY